MPENSQRFLQSGCVVWWACLLMLLLPAPVGAEEVVTSPVAPQPLPRVPAGFTIERVAGSPLVQHPMLGGFDEQGRLYIAASAGKNLRAEPLQEELPNFVQRLEDTDGDGRFDKATVFADRMTFPMGALWYRGSLYVAAPPHIWKLTDTTGDGVADERTVLVDKFGFNGNGASVHGCFLGPGGRIYWCDGRHGHEFRDAKGNIVSTGKAARVFSCLPDGSDVEVFAGGGMDNPVEVDFWPTGEMFGTVNIMEGQPRNDTIVHWIDGGVYPRADQESCLAEFAHTGPLLPAMAELGHVAVSGTMRYRSGEFGPQYRNGLFTAIFNTHRVVHTRVERNGSTFRSTTEDFLVSDDPNFHPTDVLEDADGSLLVIDTGGWFRIGCPTSQVARPEFHGAIYRIRREGAHQIADPRGRQLKLAERAPQDLTPLLGDARFSVREQAIDRLALAGEAAVPVLKAVIENRGDVDEPAAKAGQPGETAAATPEVETAEAAARRRAVWALARMRNGRVTGELLRKAASDPAESVRLAAARSLGDAGDPLAIPVLEQRVVSDTPAVRRTAATSLGRMARAGGIPAEQAEQVARQLLHALRHPQPDRFLEHAVIMALIRLDSREHTLPGLADPSPGIRRAALIALDQMETGGLTRELVVPLLDTDDPALQEQVLAVISAREGWAEETLGLLRSWLTRENLEPAQRTILRGFLLAQAGDASIQQLMATTLTAEETSEATRLDLLDVMYRATIAGFPGLWNYVLAVRLPQGTVAEQMQVVRVIASRGLTSHDQALRKLALSEQTDPLLRMEAAAALGQRLKTMPPALFAFLLQQLDLPYGEPLEKLAAARAVNAVPLEEAQLRELTKHFEAAGPLAAPLLIRSFAGSQSVAAGKALVSALTDSTVARTISPHELTRILRGFPDEVQRAAEPLLAGLGLNPAQQEQRLAELLPLTSGGDLKAGEAVFFGRTAACSRCHQVRGKGGRVGPDLSRIGRIRTGGDLLESVVFPSASLARGFGTYSVLTEDGRIHSGVISRESAGVLTLRTADLAELPIPRSRIEEIRESPASIMPQGLDRTLREEELRDLLTWLKSLK